MDFTVEMFGSELKPYNWINLSVAWVHKIMNRMDLDHISYPGDLFPRLLKQLLPAMSCIERRRAARSASGDLVPGRTGGRGSEDPEVETVEPPLSLGQKWEACRLIRARLRETENFRLIKWVKPELVNKPTMAGIALNCRSLTLLAEWWCPQQKHAKSPSVLDLKKEAQC